MEYKSIVQHRQTGGDFVLIHVSKFVVLAFVFVTAMPSNGVLGNENSSAHCGRLSLIVGICMGKVMGTLPTAYFGLIANEFCSSCFNGNNKYEVPVNSPLLKMPGLIINTR